jgi:hypothetical protein
MGSFANNTIIKRRDWPRLKCPTAFIADDVGVSAREALIKDLKTADDILRAAARFSDHAKPELKDEWHALLKSRRKTSFWAG